MSASQFDHAAFNERLISLGILSAELAQIIGRSAAVIDKWREGRSKPDAEARVLLRVLDDDHVATLAAERIRSRRTQSIHGEDWQSAGVEVPYGGGFAGADAGRAS